MPNKEKKTITKMQLIQDIASSNKVSPNEVRVVLQSLLDEITRHLSEGNRLEFRDFGVFEVVTRKSKIGRNPKKASVPIVIPERNVVKFTPGKKMKELIEETTSAANIPTA